MYVYLKIVNYHDVVFFKIKKPRYQESTTSKNQLFDCVSVQKYCHNCLSKLLGK